MDYHKLGTLFLISLMFYKVLGGVVPDDEEKPQLRLQTDTTIGKDGGTRMGSDLELQPGGGVQELGPVGSPGPEGPLGQKGLTGPQGPQGLPGPSTLGGGTNYVRWGLNYCNQSEALYSGVAAGAWYGSANGGGGADILCLPDTSEFLAITPELQGPDQRNRIYPTEYQTGSGPALQGLNHYNVPCAACYVAERSETIMIPGKISCPDSWNVEYYGYLLSDHAGHSRLNYVCVDVDAREVPDSFDNSDGPSLLYFVEVTCNGIDCSNSKYQEGAEMPCVVCTK